MPMHSMSIPICAGKVLAGMLKKVCGRRNATVAVSSVQTGNRLQNVVAYWRSRWTSKESGGGTDASRAVMPSISVEEEDGRAALFGWRSLVVSEELVEILVWNGGDVTVTGRSVLVVLLGADC